MHTPKFQAIESTHATIAVLHEAKAPQCQTMHMPQRHTAQEARQQHSSKDTKQRSQRQKHRQAAAASRDKPERRGSNIPGGAPSQAVLPRKRTPLQRRPATRHLQKETDTDTLVLHSHDHKQPELYYAANAMLQVLLTLETPPL
jgi:hypothetical protein